MGVVMKKPSPSMMFQLLALYLAVSTIAYRFSHTGMSETELFLAVPRALIWSW
jgi:hypothetical protein